MVVFHIMVMFNVTVVLVAVITVMVSVLIKNLRIVFVLVTIVNDAKTRSYYI